MIGRLLAFRSAIWPLAANRCARAPNGCSGCMISSKILDLSPHNVGANELRISSWSTAQLFCWFSAGFVCARISGSHDCMLLAHSGGCCGGKRFDAVFSGSKELSFSLQRPVIRE